MIVDNAIIMAAGLNTRFALSPYEKHKALTVVKGEVLIERQIEQLKSAGISDVYVVTGYKAELFDYLRQKYDVTLIYNTEFLTRNNHASIWAARKVLNNSYVCSSDNYFCSNPFEKNVDYSYYAAQYAFEHTDEWCMTEDENGYINAVTVGGENAWYMMGHTFWSQEFSEKYLSILEEEYDLPETVDKLWETMFISHLDQLKMKIRKYPSGMIYEFDTVEELAQFDESYVVKKKYPL